jgi:hypothetical protein
MADDVKNQTRQLAKLVRELVRPGPYDHLADLLYDLRNWCRALKVPCEDDALNAALRLVESNTPLVAARGRRPGRRSVVTVAVSSVPAHDEVISKRDAPGVQAWVFAELARRSRRRA